MATTKKIPFSVTMRLLAMLKKMGFNFNLEASGTAAQIGGVILQEIILKLPNVQEEFIELLNEIAGTNYDMDSDTFEIIGTLQAEYKGITTAFTQAWKLKSSIS